MLEFDKKNHLYTLDGKCMTGVTTVLKVISKGDSLIQWAANEAVKYIIENERTEKHTENGDTKGENWYAVYENTLNEAKTVHRKKKEEAGSVGTDIHKNIEDIIKLAIDKYDGHLSTSDYPLGQVKNFTDWAIENKVKFLASEVMVCDSSPDMFYAGTLDFVAEIDGKKFIGDIKTGSGIYPEHFYQVAAYQNAWEKMGREKLDGAVIVNVTKKGELKVEYSYFFKEDFDAFKGALAIYKRQNKVTN